MKEWQAHGRIHVALPRVRQGRARAGTADRLKTHLLIAIGVVGVLLLLGRSAPAALEVRTQTIGIVSGRWAFDLTAWEVSALIEKLGILVGRPAANLDEEEQVARVEQYIDDAQRAGQLEDEINRLLSIDATPQLSAEVERLRAELTALRAHQGQVRPTVEAILQAQVARELAEAGLGWRGVVFPPVSFTFTEPPKKLTVSPRERIATVYSRMLAASMDPVTIETGEREIEARTDLSAYISAIGGLGAYPTMVIDRASLPWVLSTIAHEWTHNYLAFFPLGLRYGASGDLTILNETVADIAGDEIGARLVRRYYPELLPEEGQPAPGKEAVEERPPVDAPPPFDFRREMRETRLRVDALLDAGLVETAEAYMEARRRYFVAHGYPLRVLNQAYFAFHGNYATGAAASSPLGPKLLKLRAQSLDLAVFLDTVRWFTGAGDLDQALLAGRTE